MVYSERYEQIVSRLLTLATEAHIYANENMPGEFLQLRELEQSVRDVVLRMANQHGYSWDRLAEVGDQADEQAIDRVSARLVVA